MKTILTLFGIFWSVISLSAQTELYVIDPDRPWYHYAAEIEEASLHITPQGIYSQVDLTLQIKNFDNLSWPNLLEIVMDFTLPKGSFMIDSWLWFEDSILVARHIDRWSAIATYESIVNRRKDPSLLIKNGADRYQLNVFPLNKNESRKVRISYLTPNGFANNTFYTPLPSDILKAAYKMPKNVTLTIASNPEFDKLSIQGIDTELVEFTPYRDTSYGEVLLASLPAKYFAGPLKIVLPTKSTSNYFLQTVEKNGEYYYQLAIDPKAFLEIPSQPKKLAIVMDYNRVYTNYSFERFANELQQFILEKFTEIDSFNIIFSTIEILRASDTWLPADNEGVKKAFNFLKNQPVSSFSSLPGLIASGLSFVEKNGNDVNVLLISAGDSFGEQATANAAMEEINPWLQSSNAKILTADYSDLNKINHRYFAGRSWRGNEYFYTLLARRTGGEVRLVGYITNPFPSLLTDLYGYLSNPTDAMDAWMNPEAGFTYNRFTIGQSLVSPENPILQTGQFVGDLPFEFNLFAKSGKNVYIGSATLSSVNSFGKEATSKIWMANHIQNLETVAQSNNEIHHVIDIAIHNRILSFFTAFLALEPGQEVLNNDCFGCVVEDPNIIINTDMLPEPEIKISASPNPFSQEVTIIVQSDGVNTDEDAHIKIYNLKGQLVKQLSNLYWWDATLKTTWNAQNEQGLKVPAGEYIAVVEIGGKIKSIKLLKI